MKNEKETKKKEVKLGNVANKDKKH